MIIRINTFLQKLLTTSTSYKLGLRNFLHCAWPRRDWLHSPWLKRKLSNVYLSILAYMYVCLHVCFACVGVYVCIYVRNFRHNFRRTAVARTPKTENFAFELFGIRCS